MKEELLHFAWKMRRFDMRALTTCDGEEIIIHQFGHHNHQQGPDFSAAKISVGGTTWIGQVEMHLNASDWYKHGHEKDPAYDAVILHVVLDADKEVYRSDGSKIPCLEIKKRIPSSIYRRYAQLQSSAHWIPCERVIHKVNDVSSKLWIEKVAVKRLEEKSVALERLYQQSESDWETCFYYAFMSAFGMPHNKDAFEQLARSLPLKLLEKYREDKISLEAILLGQAGFIPIKGQSDTYTEKLSREYTYLSKVHSLEPMALSIWKFGGIRPGHFPTIRLMQFAAIFSRYGRLLHTFLDIADLKDFYSLMSVPVNGYWESHYRPSDEGNACNEYMGKHTMDIILVNTIIPFMFLYSRLRFNEEMRAKAFMWMQSIPAEKNSLLRNWQERGVNAENAIDSQGLLHLYHNYCKQRKCLECGIGANLFHLEEGLSEI